MDKVYVNMETNEVTYASFTAEEIAERETFERDVLPVKQMEFLRARRNQLLAETDHLALSDHVLSAEMTAYRQALRDLPANTTDPANPVFPTKPGA